MPDPAAAADPRNWPLGTATSGLAAPGPDGFGACAAAGITHLELDLFGRGVDAASPDGRAALAALARQATAAGLTLWSAHLPFGGRWDLSAADAGQRRWALQQQTLLLRAVAGWGAGVAVIHPSAEPIAPDERAARLYASAAALAELAAEAERLGVRLAVECLPRTCLGNSAAEIRALLEGSPALGVCCDVNHVFGETPAGFIRAVGGRIITLHISDNDGADERHWLPGEGGIDWSAVIAALSATGYRGPFLFEVHPHAPADLAAAWARLLQAAAPGRPPGRGT